MGLEEREIVRSVEKKNERFETIVFKKSGKKMDQKLCLDIYIV